MTEDLRKIYIKIRLALVLFKDNCFWTLLMPGMVIMDKQGIILHADVDPDDTKRSEPRDIIRLLQEHIL